LTPLNGDIIDNDELMTGKRREGVYAGLNALSAKPAVSIGNWIFMSIIAYYGFQRPTIVDGVITKYVQTETAINGILLAMSLIPGLFIFIGALIMIKYPLDGPKWLMKKAELQKLHFLKDQEYLKHLQAQK
jgi:GPH family glycoside/pentoside/hexuronide:cation symporter